MEEENKVPKPKPYLDSETVIILRINKGDTQIDMAKALGVSQSIISVWEGGKRSPSPRNLRRLAAYYDKSIEEVVIYG